MDLMRLDTPGEGAEVEVLIVGGEPVGLTARALLERWGVQVLLVEKRRELSPFPRSRLVNVRSMEICRRLGLAEEITAAAFAPEYGRIRFRDTLHAPDHWEPHAVPPWPLRIEPLPGECASPWGLSPQGALLVRPDGHIAARWSDGPPAEATLRDALTTLTGH